MKNFKRPLVLFAVLLLLISVSPLANSEAKHAEKELILFWAEWCGYCKEAIATISELEKEGRLSGYKVLLVEIGKDDSGLGISKDQSGRQPIPVVALAINKQILTLARPPRAAAGIEHWVSSIDSVHWAMNPPQH